MGGILTVSVGHPFDTCKVRMQATASHAPEYSSTFDCFKKILKNEGVTGLFKGMGAPITTVAPMNALNFFGYGTGVKLFSNDENGGRLASWQYFVSGGLSGIATAVLVTPGERIKCILQVQETTQGYSGPIDVARKLTAQYGIFSLFKGINATLLRDVPAYGAYYATYEAVKFGLASQEAGQDPWLLLKTILSGAMAGLAYWGVGIPADVLKTRLQTASEDKYPHGIRSVFSELMKTEGPRGLYRGAAPVFIRAIPANSACFVGIELTLQVLSKVS
ncbi:hypothetical protein WDU94_014597 [Cyamophila willieti]